MLGDLGLVVTGACGNMSIARLPNDFFHQYLTILIIFAGFSE
jgi:hypothetical protein